MFISFSVYHTINVFYQYYHTIYKKFAWFFSGMLTETSLQTKKPKRKGVKITAPFNNMQTLQLFKAQPTNVFFATINQVLRGSPQLPTTTEGMVIKSLSTVQTTKQCLTVVGSWEELPNI